MNLHDTSMIPPWYLHEPLLFWAEGLQTITNHQACHADLTCRPWLKKEAQTWLGTTTAKQKGDVKRQKTERISRACQRKSTLHFWNRHKTLRLPHKMHVFKIIGSRRLKCTCFILKNEKNASRLDEMQISTETEDDFSNGETEGLRVCVCVSINMYIYNI